MNYWSRITIFVVLAAMTVLITPASSVAQGCPNCPTSPPEGEENIVLPKDFQPTVLDTELQRAVTVGNPPRKPQWFHPLLPSWFRRPVEIPKSYPMREQDGERFTR